MEKKEILTKVQNILRDVLDNKTLILDPQKSADDIEEYDSLSHIQIVVAIEKEFNIKFTAKEIIDWDSFEDMLSNISKKLS